MMSSIQSVAGQPVALPLSKPMHHGDAPSFTILSLSAISSSKVFGIVYPLASNAFFGYQIMLLRLMFDGTP